jgi:hypothetical protein
MIKADGSYSRTVVFTVSKNNVAMGGMMTPPGEGAETKPPKDKPEDYFKLPVAREGMRVVRSEDKNSFIVTATRDAATGAAAVQDISLLAGKTVFATSTVKVTKLPDGRVEYLETLHGSPPATAAQQFSMPEIRVNVKRVLPAESQTTALIDKVTHEVELNYVHALFGPPEPTIFSLMMTPDTILRRVNAYAFVENSRCFREAIPGLSEVQSKEMARSLAQSLTERILDQTDSMSQNSKPKSESGDNDMTPLAFAVKFPGTIVETNGLIDPITGEVYWSLIPLGLQAGDAHLRLVFQP